MTQHTRWRGWLAGAASVVCLAGAGAQAQPMPGDREVRGSIGIFHAQGSSSGSFTGDVGLGYFLPAPRWQLGLMQSVSYTLIDDDPDVWAATSAPFLNIHLPGLLQADAVLPFVGGFLGAVYNDDDVTGVVGPQGGVKLFVTSQVFIGVSYRYEWFFSDITLGRVTSDGNHVGSIGIGFVFGNRERLSRQQAQRAWVEQAERITERAEAAARRAEEAARRAEELQRAVDEEDATP